MDKKSVLPSNLRTKLFVAVLEFMNRCGLNEPAVRESFDAALKSTFAPRKVGASKNGEGLYVKAQNLPAQLLRKWHRESRLIDSQARPRALMLTKGRNSLRSEIQRIDSTVDAEAALQGMKKAGLIRRTANGRYLPTSEAAIIDQLHPLSVEHVTKLVSRLISTVGRNMDPQGRSLSLIDRHAYTTDLKPSERRAFANFTRSHGMACLESVDDWLEKRRVSRVQGPTSRTRKEEGLAAGVYLFAYLGDDEGIQSLRASGSKARAPRAGVRALPRTSRSRRAKPARAARA